MKNMNDIFDFKRFGKYFITDIKGCTAEFGHGFLIISFSGIITYAVYMIFNLLFGNEWSGPGYSFRIVIFILAGMVLTAAMPSRCFGKITDRRKGSDWLLLPVSLYEKYISMILISCILIPAAFVLIYFSADALLCLADKTCGIPLTHTGEMYRELFDGIDYLGAANSGYISNMYANLDDIMSGVLVFLLGALVFKKGKISKTILSIIALSCIVSIIFITPFFGRFNPEDPTYLLYGFDNLKTMDLINDITLLVLLLAAVFFRLKTLKH